MNRIVLGYPVTPEQVGRIAAVANGWQVVAADPARVGEELLSAGIFCGHAKVPVDWDQVVARGQLQWIHSTAAGLDHCLVPPVLASPIPVSGSSGLFADQVAEQTLALLFGVIRGLPAFFRAQQARTFERLPVDDLRLKDVLVLGCGGNGREICERLVPLARSVTATDLFPGAVETGGRYAVRPAEETDRLLSAADVVISVLPLLPETERYLDLARLSRIRAGGYLINVGRGRLVDEVALVGLLQSGHLRAAGLDVFAEEPPPADHPFWTMPNLLMTPHVGAQSATRYEDVTRLFLENLRRWLAGQQLINAVDKKMGMPLPAVRLPAGWRNLPWAREQVG